MNKMIIFYVILFTFNALSSSIVASFLHTDWAKLSGTEQFVLIWVIVQNWTGTMIALFNRAASKVQKGEVMIDDNPTDQTVNSTAIPQTQKLVN